MIWDNLQFLSHSETGCFVEAPDLQRSPPQDFRRLAQRVIVKRLVKGHRIMDKEIVKIMPDNMGRFFDLYAPDDPRSSTMTSFVGACRNNVATSS